MSHTPFDPDRNGIVGFPFREPPMSHQVDALRKAWPRKAFALFHEMGLGKTYTAINLMAARFMFGQITHALVWAPTPIKAVWVSEINRFLPSLEDPVSAYVLDTASTADNFETFLRSNSRYKIMVVGIEAMSNGFASDLCREFVQSSGGMCMAVVDESSKIKNHKAQRTEVMIDIASDADYRLIMTGTPVSQGITDLFSQFWYLHWSIIGAKNYFVFKNRYCLLGGYKNKKVVGYQFVDHLMEKIRKFVHIVRKEDALDLPPKVYETVYVDITKEQKKIMMDLEDIFEATVDEHTLTVRSVLSRLTRFQQVIGGHFPFDEVEGFGTKPVPGKNPKIEAMMDIIQGLGQDRKVIIWARFKPEIETIKAALAAEYGDLSVVTFYGPDSDEQRVANKDAFQNNPAVRFIVSNQQTGGMGQTWTAAHYVIYFSNTYSLLDREQSEDRAHRKGLEHTVTYIDIIANDRRDKMIVSCLKSKKDVADYVEDILVTGDVHNEDGRDVPRMIY